MLPLESFLETERNFYNALQLYGQPVKMNLESKMSIICRKKIIKTQKKETKINKMSEFLCHREMGDAKRLSAFRFLLVLTITPSTYNDRGVTGLNREMQTVCGIASSAAGIGRRIRGVSLITI